MIKVILLLPQNIEWSAIIRNCSSQFIQWT